MDKVLLDKSPNHLKECFELMLTYKDNPMDFADASLVVTAGNIDTLDDYGYIRLGEDMRGSRLIF